MSRMEDHTPSAPLDGHLNGGLTAREALEQRLDDYLEGLLDVAETRAVERLLADPEVAALLAEAIAMRELLGAFPEAPLPAGLEARIFDALGVEDARRVRSTSTRPVAATNSNAAQLALAGAGRAVRETRRSSGGRAAWAGLKLALTPWGLLNRGATEEPEPKAKKRPLWKRALRLGRRR